MILNDLSLDAQFQTSEKYWAAVLLKTLVSLRRARQVINKMADLGEGFAILSLVGEPWSFNEQICFAWQVRPNFFSVANQAIINMGLS